MRIVFFFQTKTCAKGLSKRLAVSRICLCAEDLMQLGPVAKLFEDDSVTNCLKKLNESSRFAQIEEMHWEKTKNMTPEEKGIFFLKQVGSHSED